MAETSSKYVIVGGGLAAAEAAAGIRERDSSGEVLILTEEPHLPYHRPPLTKSLWSGKKRVEDIFVQDRDFYEQNDVTFQNNTQVAALDARKRLLVDSQGATYRFERLLLATGGRPAKLGIPGAELEGIAYYRYLDDYLRVRRESEAGRSALVIGGGFIGSEISAALSLNKIEVTLLFPEKHLCARVLPDYLARAIQDHYVQRGIRVLAGDKPVAITKRNGRFTTTTMNGKQIETDMVIVGIGIVPGDDLARRGGLRADNGIMVDASLRTEHPDIYAAGDNAFFPCRDLDRALRVEHWDNAKAQGRLAGWNLAGAKESYTYLPYFFSDLFEFGYEAVGEVDSRLATFADWKKENDSGVIYYLRDGRVRGVLLCNTWEKLEPARELILRAEPVKPESLRGAIA